MAIPPPRPPPSEILWWIQIDVVASKRHTAVPLCLAIFGRQSTTRKGGLYHTQGQVISSRHLKHFPDHRSEDWRTQLKTAREHINSLSLWGWGDLPRFLGVVWRSAKFSIKRKDPFWGIKNIAFNLYKYFIYKGCHKIIEKSGGGTSEEAWEEWSRPEMGNRSRLANDANVGISRQGLKEP